MSSFTDKLVVSKVGKRLWRVERAFEYHVGAEDSGEVVKIPLEFVTDFASVPRLLWVILPPDGQYTQAAVVHDYLYFSKIYDRKKSDDIFLEAMGVLGVSRWKRFVMHKALRMFGWLAWRKNDKKNKR